MPAPTDPLGLSLVDLAAAIAARKLSALDVVSAALDRAAALNPKLNAFLELFPERARAEARALDEKLARGAGGGGAGAKPGPLAGVPIALKDNMCLGSPALDRGKTTCGSKILADYRSPFTGTA